DQYESLHHQLSPPRCHGCGSCQSPPSAVYSRSTATGSSCRVRTTRSLYRGCEVRGIRFRYTITILPARLLAIQIPGLLHRQPASEQGRDCFVPRPILRWFTSDEGGYFAD